MKKIISFLFSFFIISNSFLFAQGVAINTTGTSPDNSAILDVSSDSAGILIPRMTEELRDAITSPAIGLMIYQTDGIVGFYYFNGSAWDEVSSRRSVLSILECIQNGVRDVDGNHYKTVLIGDQVWMAENLATTKYNDGIGIPLVTDNGDWVDLVTPGYCWYENNQETYGDTYGALYNWYTINTGNLCPTGWHVPSDTDWTTLTSYLGGSSVAGGKLKEAGTEHWISTSTDVTNETNFTALPGGDRSPLSGFFDHLGIGGVWWSSTEANTTFAKSIRMNDSNSAAMIMNSYKGTGLSVRCLRD